MKFDAAAIFAKHKARVANKVDSDNRVMADLWFSATERAIIVEYQGGRDKASGKFGANFEFLDLGESHEVDGDDPEGSSGPLMDKPVFRAWMKDVVVENTMKLLGRLLKNIVRTAIQQAGHGNNKFALSHLRKGDSGFNILESPLADHLIVDLISPKMVSTIVPAGGQGGQGAVQGGQGAVQGGQGTAQSSGQGTAQSGAQSAP
ncbi:hypothetical protein GGR52DRAFT_575388 [Hypoxylon sp. FL1284]|nr:hypothetical protein GGR52DRAFT_575388 [Hypoxylon sp. FL1284]